MPFCKYTAWEVNIVSAKAYEALSKSNELTPVSEAAQSPEQRNDDEKERKKRIRGTLIKFGSLAVFAFIVWVFATISWFTMNTQVESGGMSLKTQGLLFTIQPVPSPYVVGIYDDSTKTGTYVRNTLLSGASKNSSVLTWTITNDTATTNPDTNKTTINKGKNIGNGPAAGYEGGISPGSSGELQFKFIPSRSVDAELTFYLYAYSVDYDEQGDEDKSTIALIGENATTDRQLAKNLLNGHILLFEDYDSTTGRYSGLISTDDFQRIMSETYTQETTESVYWVWAETLAELVLDDTNNAHKKNLRGKKSLCANQSDIIKLLKNNPSWFFLDPETPNRTWTEFTSTTADATVVSTINSNYSLYSAYYNEADQCIGTNVAYLLLDMTADGIATPTP